MNEPIMIGRQRLLSEVLRFLDQSSPVNLTLVGPALIGKTIFLKHTSKCIQQSRDWCVIYFDFAEQLVKTDQEFWQAYSDQLRRALDSAGSESAEYLSPDSEYPARDVRECFDELGEEGTKLLTVFDHFDRVLQTDISLNTWGVLRYLASEYKSCVTWTASRMAMGDICFSEEIKDSHFPNVFFPQPVSLGCFDKADIDIWLKELEETRTIETPAKKEIENWTGGIPVLLKELCYHLANKVDRGKTISKVVVDSTAAEAIDSSQNLRSIWEGCGQETRRDLYQLSQGPIPESQIGRSRANELIHRGVALSEGNKLKSSCRMMEHYSAAFGKDETDLERSFRDVESFDKNIGKVLLLRLKKIRKRHEELHSWVERSILGLNDPDSGLVCARKIRNSALAIIWRDELDKEGKIPKEVAEHWQGRVNQSSDIFEDVKNRVKPQTESEQLRMLEWLTGTPAYKKMSKRLSKSTVVALNHIHELGNYDNHAPEGEPRSVMFGASHCLSALTILENLTEDQ